MDEESGEGLSVAVGPEQGFEDLIGKDVAVLNEELGFVPEERRHVAHSARGAEQLRLVRVG